MLRAQQGLQPQQPLQRQQRQRLLQQLQPENTLAGCTCSRSCHFQYC